MASVTVLSYAERLPAGARKDLARLAKGFARSGAFLAIRHDPKSGRLSFFKVPERIAGPDLQREEPVAERGRGKGRGRPTRGRPIYKAKRGSARISTGSVQIGKGGRWTGRIEVPAEGNVAALLTIQRKGRGATLLPKDAALVIPEGEAEAVLALLNGLFAKARRDGVL